MALVGVVLRRGLTAPQVPLASAERQRACKHRPDGRVQGRAGARRPWVRVTECGRAGQRVAALLLAVTGKEDGVAAAAAGVYEGLLAKHRELCSAQARPQC